jgi:photosynthetic reaction center cytochrome c subunit
MGGKRNPRVFLVCLSAITILGVSLATRIIGQTPARRPHPEAQARVQKKEEYLVKPLMSDQFFHNVQVLRGIPVDQFLGTMGFISASLGVNCTECHGAGDNGVITDYAADTPEKQKARQMMIMVKILNQTSFGGDHRVTCYTCHRGDISPHATPSLAVQNGPAPDRDPNDIELLDQPIPGAPTAEQILDKYIEVLGGAEQLAKITSLSGKGTYSGFDTELAKAPVEVYAKSPGESTTIVHRSDKAENITTFDGRSAWVVMTDTFLPVKPLTGGELDNAQLDAEMFFPANIKSYLHNWRVGFPPITVDGHLVQIVQGTAPRGSRVKLFFDAKSGLLVRMALFSNTALGLNPSEVDYSDYRELDGVEVPYHWTLTWTDGRSDFDMTEMRANVSLDADRFGQAILPH